MTALLDPPLTARNGYKLRGLLICRVSDPEKKKKQTTKKKRRRSRPRRRQDERSLDDQEAMHREWVAQHTTLPFENDVIAGTGSGEWLDREGVKNAVDAIKSELYDLVATEDLGRIVRRQKAFELCELAEDHGVRIFALNDHVDTGRSDWRLSAYFASMRHELYNQDLRRRIRRSHRNRFQQGDVFQCEIYGLVVPDPVDDEPVNDEDVTKDPTAEPIYDEWFTKLEQDGTFAEIADWLNEKGIPTGPYCRLDKWDSRMVGRVTRNPILKGLRVRNDRISKRVNSTGRSRSVKAPPEERLERECPHLAFISLERYDRVLAKVNARNAIYRRGKNGSDPRVNVSRKRTRFPGQASFCGICGRMFVFSGHGQTDHLMCEGARQHRCWNGVTIDAVLAAKRFADAVSREVEMLRDFDSTFLEMLRQEAHRASESLDVESARIRLALQQAEAEAANLLPYLKDGQSELVGSELRRAEEEIARHKLFLADAERTRPTTIELPSSEELKQLYHGLFQDLAADSYEFAGHLRRLVPRIVVFPYQLCDGGKVVLRARFRLQLASLIPDVGTRTLLQTPLEKLLEIDLYEMPQRAMHRQAISKLRGSGLTEREAAHQLGLIITAAQNAAALQRLMDQMGISDPYLAVTSPDGCGKLRRHLHPRYKFEPLENAGTV